MVGFTSRVLTPNTYRSFVNYDGASPRQFASPHGNPIAVTRLATRTTRTTLHPHPLRRHHPRQNEDEGATTTTLRQNDNDATMQQRGCVVLTYLIQPSTYDDPLPLSRRHPPLPPHWHNDDDGALPRPSLHPLSLHAQRRRRLAPAYGKCHTDTHSLDSPSPRQLAHMCVRAHWLPRLLNERS